MEDLEAILLLNIIATLTQHFTNTGTTLYNHQMSD